MSQFIRIFFLATCLIPMTLQAQDLRTQNMGLEILDRVAVYDLIKTPQNLYIITNNPGNEMEKQLQQYNHDGTAGRVLATGPYQSFISSSGLALLIWNPDGEVRSYDPKTSKESVVFKEPIFDPPVYYNDAFYYSRTDEGFIKFDPKSKKKTLVCTQELIFPTVFEDGIAGWVKEEKDYSLVYLDKGVGTPKILHKAVPGQLVQSQGKVYYGSYEKGIFSADLKTGTRQKISDLKVEGQLIINGSSLFFSAQSDGGTLHQIQLPTLIDTTLSTETGCRIIKADQKGFYYYRSRNPFDEGSKGVSEYLGFWNFDGKGNRERLFSNQSFVTKAIGSGYAIGTLPDSNLGLGLIDLRTFKITPLVKDMADYRNVFILGQNVYFMKGMDPGTLYQVPISGKSPPVPAYPKPIIGAIPLGNDLALLEKDQSPLQILSPSLKLRSLKIKPVGTLCHDGNTLYYFTPGVKELDLHRLDLESEKDTLIQSGVTRGMGRQMASEPGRLFYFDGLNIRAYDKAKNTQRIIASIKDGFSTDIVLGEKMIFFTVDSGGGDGIYQVPKEGGNFKKIVDGELFGLAWDQGWIYWFNDWIESRVSQTERIYGYRIKVE